jgi:hypothetical protein
MPLDPLAARLKQLLTEGSIPASDFSAAMRVRLGSLFDFNVLVDEKAGGGRRTVVSDRAALERWVTSKYPSGLDGTDQALPARAEAVANFRDSKAGRKLATLPLFMRGFGQAAFKRRTESLPLAVITASHEIVGVLIDLDDPWLFDGTLALVENFELFMHVEDVVPGVEVALWTGGRFNERAFSWIAGLTGCKVVHVGDYDPVGLDEYLRLRACLPEGRVSLHVPHDFEQRVAAYGNAELLERSVAVLQRVRRDAPEELRPVLAVIDRHGKALEQEGLLIGIGLSDGHANRADTSHGIAISERRREP